MLFDLLRLLKFKSNVLAFSKTILGTAIFSTLFGVFIAVTTDWTSFLSVFPLVLLCMISEFIIFPHVKKMNLNVEILTYEELKKNDRITFRIIEFLKFAIFLPIPLTFIGFMTMQGVRGPLPIWNTILLFSVFMILPLIRMKYLFQFKRRILLQDEKQQIWKKHFEALSYEIDSGFEQVFIFRLNIFHQFRNAEIEFSSSNLISGIYNNIPFQQADLIISDNSGGGWAIDKFYGRWISFKFNRNFPADIQIRNRRYAKHLEPSRLLRNRYKEITGKSVFFDKFTIYVDSVSVEVANDFLTNSLQETLLFLTDKYGMQLTYIVFRINELHIGIDVDRTKLLGMKTETILKTMEDEAKSIKLIIDTLQLYDLNPTGHFLNFQHLENSRNLILDNEFKKIKE